MICRIAELGVSVPDLGNLSQRCDQYLAEIQVDIVIPSEKIKDDRFSTLSPEDNIYLDSGFLFYDQLLDYDGMMLHASAVMVKGKAYLFSGPCGIGKSTHTSLYMKAFPEAVILNDDKPALRRVDGKWMVYGTPWCGKDGINANASAPLAGICFLHRGDNQIKSLSPLAATVQLLPQTGGRRNAAQAEKLMELINCLVQEVPIIEFYNHAQPGDEQITYRALGGC